MNKLVVGVQKKFNLPKGGYLYINDEVPRVPRGKIFDPRIHSFNALSNMDYKKARDFAALLYGLSPQGENTLTVRNGKRALVKLLLQAERLDALGEGGDDAEKEAVGMVEDLMVSPLLRRVLCGEGEQFSFSPDAKILARINRAELGEFDALAIGHFLIGQYQGQVIVPEFGWYGRDRHVSLIQQERLIAGVNYLSELPASLRAAALLIDDKKAQGCLFEDAEMLAKFAGLRPDPSRVDNPYDNFIREGMGV